LRGTPRALATEEDVDGTVALERGAPEIAGGHARGDESDQRYERPGRSHPGSKDDAGDGA
jgi:hypothetical protein